MKQPDQEVGYFASNYSSVPCLYSEPENNCNHSAMPPPITHTFSPCFFLMSWGIPVRKSPTSQSSLSQDEIGMLLICTLRVKRHHQSPLKHIIYSLVMIFAPLRMQSLKLYASIPRCVLGLRPSKSNIYLVVLPFPCLISSFVGKSLKVKRYIQRQSVGPS